ncbi:activator-dependent family glycosyltransferase [Nocardiopsis ansamitocini]|uniref:Glycosyl transferase n=1 Tax=Nocardiopsis ansamitocini TaxID=1670832 RepID=A0A9W6UIK3_9ACTN|nr:activator-dependent family glycosyltransferase [Nocardiopsis ansamitocini]GLU50026.1 glycosyl transferase [Nocardiopsis ansamitocini]
MRVVIAAQAERTHFLGMVPVAWALRAAGHEVRVASQPELEGVVTGAGLPFVPVGKDHTLRATLRRLSKLPGAGGGLDWADDRIWDLPWTHLRVEYRQMVSWWWRMVNEPMLGDLVALCRQWRPDLVIWEPTTFAGAIAARACGAAHVRFLWGVDLFSQTRAAFLRRMGEQPPDQQEDPLAAWLTALAARYGLDYDEELVHGQATIDFVPPALKAPTPPPGPHYLPTRYVPYNGRAVVPHWLRTPPHRPRICLTLGTSTADWFGDYTVAVKDVLSGLADLDAEIIATIPAAQQHSLGPVPANTRLVDYVPLHALTPTCHAMITHGGPGTVFTSLTHGVPQVITPHPRLFDTPLLAQRVAQAGAGLVLPPAVADADAVCRGVARLIAEPRFARSADRLRREMQDMPAPADLVPLLHDLTG